MSQQLAVLLMAVAINLVGMLVIYALLAHAVTGLTWRRRGVMSVIGLIVAAQLFWLAPALLVVIPRDPESASSYALWFGNWLVCAFGLILLWRTAARIPPALKDAARVDGLGGPAIWRHVVLPFVRCDLVLIAFLTVMATVVPFWGFMTQPQAGDSIVLFQRFLSPQGRLALMIAVSLVGALPLIALFFLTSPRQRSGLTAD